MTVIASEDVEWLDEDEVDTTRQSNCFCHRRLHHLEACQLLRTVNTAVCRFCGSKAVTDVTAHV